MLIDYYLIPGAEWSLIKKGDTVKVLGKAGTDGRWYRCMAQCNVNVEVPGLSLPPPSIVNALLPGKIIGQTGSDTMSRSSQLQHETVMEEPSEETAEKEDGTYIYMYTCD